MTQVLIVLATVFLSVQSASAASKDSTDVMAVVNSMLEAFNTGDSAKLAATSADEIFIIDELPPYAWSGKGALWKWMNDYGIDAAKKELTDGVVTLAKVKHVFITGSDAYVVTNTDYVYNEKGKQVKQLGASLTLVLRKGADGWRITAWSWATS